MSYEKGYYPHFNYFQEETPSSFEANNIKVNKINTLSKINIPTSGSNMRAFMQDSNNFKEISSVSAYKSAFRESGMPSTIKQDTRDGKLHKNEGLSVISHRNSKQNHNSISNNNFKNKELDVLENKLGFGELNLQSAISNNRAVMFSYIEYTIQNDKICRKGRLQVDIINKNKNNEMITIMPKLDSAICKSVKGNNQMELTDENIRKKRICNERRFFVSHDVIFCDEYYFCGFVNNDFFIRGLDLIRRNIDNYLSSNDMLLYDDYFFREITASGRNPCGHYRYFRPGRGTLREIRDVPDTHSTANSEEQFQNISDNYL